MRVNVKHGIQGCDFDSIEAGEVFYGDDYPSHFFMRTDGDAVVAVDIETGVLYNYNDFVHEDETLYHIVKAEVNIA